MGSSSFAKITQGVLGNVKSPGGRFALPIFIDGTKIQTSRVVNIDLTQLQASGQGIDFCQSIFVNNAVAINPPGSGRMGIGFDQFYNYNGTAFSDTQFITRNLLVHENVRNFFPVQSQRPIRFQVAFYPDVNYPAFGWPVIIWLLNWRVSKPTTVSF